MALLGRYPCQPIYIGRSIQYPCRHTHTVVLSGILALSGRQYSADRYRWSIIGRLQLTMTGATLGMTNTRSP